jgi:hypothetical protein
MNEEEEEEEEEIALSYSQSTTDQRNFALEGVLFFIPFVRNRVVLFCGLVAERQYNPPSSSTHMDREKGRDRVRERGALNECTRY